MSRSSVSRSSKVVSPREVRFGGASVGLLTSSETEFIASVRWRNGQSAQPREGRERRDLKTIGLCWKQHLLERTVPDEVRAARGFYSLDAVIDAASENGFPALLKQVRESSPSGRSKNRLSSRPLDTDLVERLQNWLSGAAAEVEVNPWTLLGCCELLILHGRRLPAGLIGSLWRIALAGALAQFPSPDEAAQPGDWKTLADDQQADRTSWLVTGLLPWACGLLFDDVKGAPRLARSARAVLNDQLLTVTSEQGIPVGSILESFQSVTAVWMDALRLAVLFERPLWQSDSDVRFARLMQHMAGMLRPDGSLSGDARCSTESASRMFDSLTLAGVTRSGRWRRTLAAIAAAAGRSKKSSRESLPARVRKVKKKEIPSWQSDDAEVACLRGTWAVDSSLVSLLYHRHPVQIDMNVDGVPLLRGAWDVELLDDGQPLPFDNGWSCVCWYSDEDVDYCELHFEFEGGPKLDRHVLLSRTKQFAVISDVLSGAAARRFDLISRLPLCEGISGRRAKNSRALRLKAGGTVVRAFPLMLPQDPGLGTAGRADVETIDGRQVLTLAQSTEAGAAFCPLVLDWSGERTRSDVEWRPLTVTDFGRIDTRRSSAYRIATGDLHLVLYRAFARPERYRTVLGYQTTHETLVAAFTKKGAFEEILLVE